MKPVLLVIGLVALAFGLLFVGQGLGLIRWPQESFMIGATQWIYYGGGIAAIGAGLCFAMACDIRVAAAGASLAVNFVRLGLHPGMGATWLLPRIVGPSRASALLLTGRTITAERALAIGLVDSL